MSSSSLILMDKKIQREEDRSDPHRSVIGTERVYCIRE